MPDTCPDTGICPDSRRTVDKLTATGFRHELGVLVVVSNSIVVVVTGRQEARIIGIILQEPITGVAEMLPGGG